MTVCLPIAAGAEVSLAEAIETNSKTTQTAVDNFECCQHLSFPLTFADFYRIMPVKSNHSGVKVCTQKQYPEVISCTLP